MNYFFEKESRKKRLKIILDEWLDTPFRHKCGVKGMGCDCVHFVVKVLEEFGLIDLSRVVIPDYPRDWHQHNTREALKEAVEKYLNVEAVDVNGLLKTGDIILSHFGKASSHSGLYYEGYVYQAINQVGVKCINFNDKRFRKQMKFAYRIKEL